MPAPDSLHAARRRTVRHLAVSTRLAPTMTASPGLGPVPLGLTSRVVGHVRKRTSMTPLLVLLVCGIVLIAEPPDKTIFASLMFGARFAARWAFLGAAAALSDPCGYRGRRRPARLVAAALVARVSTRESAVRRCPCGNSACCGEPNRGAVPVLGNRLGTTPHGADRRQRVAQLAKHRRIGFDRYDVGAQRVQRGGELAGTCAEVEHPRAGRSLKRPAHRRLRVVRAVLGLRGRCCAERRTVPLRPSRSTRRRYSCAPAVKPSDAASSAPRGGRSACATAAVRARDSSRHIRRGRP